MQTIAPQQFALLVGAVAAGVSGGIAFTFSNFVMRALGQLPTDEAVRAMQAINVTVINPLFLAVFMGTGLAATLWCVAHVGFGEGPTNPWLLAATAIYVVGVVFVTIGGNVPLNDALATLTPEGLTADAWRRYAEPWLWWNHVRTVAAVAASGTFFLAAMR